MIEKMKTVCVVSRAGEKAAMLGGLRELGLVHLAERKAPGRAATERFESLSKTATMLLDYLPDKKKREKEPPQLSDAQFEEMYAGVLAAVEKKSSLESTITADRAELERISAWGDFSPADVRCLRQAGCEMHFCRVERDEYESLRDEPDIRIIHLSPVDRQEAVAVIGPLPQELAAREFALPEKSITELNVEIDACTREIDACTEVFKKAALYEPAFRAQMLKAQNDENLSSADNTAEGDGELVWISGYLPADDLPAFREAAAKNHWAWACGDVSEDDENIPTKMKFKGIAGLIKPVLDILGILPGYYEPDISLWFLLFFTLFFAMIIGDAGYGFFILIGTVALSVKTKKNSTATYLLYVLSVATIIWGAVTGTWFGLESAMNVPFLRALVIPNFANYPEYFGVTASVQQNTIMKFSFSVGAVQMVLGTLISVKRKMARRDLSFVADIGWVVSITAMYLMALYLVIGENLPFKPIAALVGLGFVLVVGFGGMAPDKSFAQGLKSGLANAFTEFLNTISCFGNVMSYIRLFAVGMAGLAIAQSFNSLAAGFGGPLIIVGAVIVIIGHALNIVMAFLSVVVHGVRLNVMEFSGQAGLEWTGIPYEPFKLNDTIKK